MNNADVSAYHLGTQAALEEADLTFAWMTESFIAETHTLGAVTSERIGKVVGAPWTGGASLTAARGWLWRDDRTPQNGI